jgi:hypothetical protein
LENGDHSSCDFSEFIQYLERKYPEGNYEDPEQKVQIAIDAINNGNYNTEFLTFYADDMGWDMDEPMLRIDANGDTIGTHEEKIKKIIYKQFEDVLNPDGREIFQQIANDLEKISQELQIFSVDTSDEDEIDFEGYIKLPIKIKPLTNGGKYGSIPYNRSTNFYQRMVTQSINFERYAEKLDDLVDLEHKKILDAAARQVKIPFADLGIEEPKKRFDKPYGFNMDILHPSSMKMKKEVSYPRVKMTLTLSKLDNKATLLYCMQYIRFLEERLPYIIDKLNFHQSQKNINNAHKKAMQGLINDTNKLEEGKKRQIKVIIRRSVLVSL